ncbi:MAG: GNAT family N-acetyltransferase [Clostridiales bacterium]|nr:GNAT family N-acetyltransferase [Clostridiales bacterium]
MITVREIDRSYFPLYDRVTQNVEVKSELKIKRVDGGLGGLVFEEIPVETYVKDLSVYDRACEYEDMFDISNWRIYMAFDGEIAVGGATVAGTTENLNMLGGRKDACVLWDIRVADGFKHQGIGQMLFDRCAAGARSDGYKQMIIECQNINVPACRFYKKQGSLLSKIDMKAYAAEGLENEVQLIWLYDL